MRTFNYSKINQLKFDSKILGLVAQIYKFAGRQELYLKQKPDDLEKLVEIAKIQSTDSSNAIEGIVTTQSRLKKLMAEKTTPKNRAEQEIAGYRDVLNIVHSSYNSIPISTNFILNLHKILYSHINNPMGGKLKNVQNYIVGELNDGTTEIIFTPVEPYLTHEYLDKICEEYNKVIGNFELEPLIAIPIFIHDFLCIHPFNDGNGRLSRLLTTLLLYRSEFYVGKYISLEDKINKTREDYYKSLRESQNGWHDGKENVMPFIKYFLGIVLSAYKDFDDRYCILENNKSALMIVKEATNNFVGRFSKRDILEFCPSLSLSSVEGSLRKLVQDKILIRDGKGKATYYIRVI